MRLLCLRLHSFPLAGAEDAVAAAALYQCPESGLLHLSFGKGNTAPLASTLLYPG